MGSALEIKCEQPCLNRFDICSCLPYVNNNSTAIHLSTAVCMSVYQWFLYSPNQDACTAVACIISFGFASGFRPVKAGIIIVGMATDNPKSNSRKFFTIAARTYKKSHLQCQQHASTESKIWATLTCGKTVRNFPASTFGFCSLLLLFTVDCSPSFSCLQINNSLLNISLSTCKQFKCQWSGLCCTRTYAQAYLIHSFIVYLSISTLLFILLPCIIIISSFIDNNEVCFTLTFDNYRNAKKNMCCHESVVFVHMGASTDRWNGIR